MLSGPAALASPPLPTGGEVVSGAGTISQNGTTLTVNQSSQSLAANWQSFDIDAGHSVVFNQPDSSSVALNRVIGPEASSIYGSLSANGKVFLVNPNGVLFAPGAEVSVGGLVASTLKISDEDFAAGRYRFTEGSGAGSVVNDGSIDGGSVALIGPRIVNNGTIRTTGGRTTFAAGDQVTVSLLDGLVTAQVDAAVANAEIQNHGQIAAHGGQVHLLAGRADSVVDALINTDGVISANSIRNENGKIYLDAGAGGTAQVNGVVDVSGADGGARGGNVTVLGKQIALTGGARIDASGSAGGGAVLVGGNWQGSGPEHHAKSVSVSGTATIKANATNDGAGGKVVLWSDGSTAFHGSIEAKGIHRGGQVETSGHDLDISGGRVSTLAADGSAGEWLLDPVNVTISASPTSGAGSAPDYSGSASGANVNVTDLLTALASNNVTISTGIAGAEAGNISVDAAINYASATPRTLSFVSTGSGGLTGASNIGGAGGALSVVVDQAGNSTFSGLIQGSGSLTKLGAGTLTLTGQNTYSGGTTLSAGTLIGRGGGGVGFLITPFGSGAIGIATGATVVVDNTPGFNHNAFNNELTGTGTASYLGSGSNRLIGNGTLSGFTGVVSIDQNVVQMPLANTAATLNISSGATFSVWDAHGNSTFGALTGNGIVSGVPAAGAGGILTIGNGGGSGTFSGVVSNASGEMALVKAGNGIQTLTGTNTYTGTTTINGGALRISADNNLGAAPGSPTAGRLILDGGTLETTANVTLNANRGITLGAAGGTFDVDSGTTLTYSGIMAGSGALTKADAGTMLLGGANTYSGTTSVNAGTLQVGNGGTTGTLGTGAATVNAAGTLRWFRSDLNVNVPNNISGTGTLSFLGTGASLQSDYLPSGNNSGFTGTVIVDRARLRYDNANDLGAAAAISVLPGGQVYATADIPNAMTLNGIGWNEPVSGFGAGALRLGSNANASGSITVQSDTRISTDGSTGTVSGLISGAGNLTKWLSGTLIFTGNNTYSGTTTVNAGTLAVTSASGLGNTSGGTTVGNGATLDLRNVALDAETITINGFFNTTTLTASTGSSSVSGNVILSTNISSTANRVAAASGAQLTLLGVISGGGSLTKTDVGTVVLSGNNVYGGATNINAGTLQVGGGGVTGTLGSGAVTVASGADLIFNRSDSVSLSGLVAHAGGITGQGDVTALIGGNLNVDRPIALTGANSSILLEAGKAVAAGTVAGGDVTLSSNVSTNATGTLTIFSGNASTAAYEARVSGADGLMRYKTYGASASDTAGAIAGTRNYYYRQRPSALSVSGITATKVYDGLLDASAVLDTSGASLSDADGDAVSLSNFTITGATFDNAHAGPRGLNVSFSGTYSYTGSGNWSVSGADYTLASYFNGTAGTITPKAISTAVNPVGKTYDGLTGSGATLSVPTGFIANDTASGVNGFLLAFDDPNAGTRSIGATGTGVLSGFSGIASGNGSGIGAGNEVAGLASDYAVVTPSPVTAVITKAPLTITANNDAKIITQSDAVGYNGASYSGFVNGETATNLSGALSITRSNSGTEAAATYSGVLVPTGYTAGNYDISYANGNFQILPAQQLLIRLQNASNTYSSSANYVVTSAEYLDGSGATLRTLTQTAQNGNTYTFSDGLGGSVTFTVAPNGAVISGAGHLAAGNYTLSGTNTSVTGSNFSNANYVGNQTVIPIGLTPAGGVSRVYDGTTSLAGAGLTFDGQLAGDSVSANLSGAFHGKNVGTNLAYDISNITLGGADAGNYFLTSSGLSANDGVITARAITIGGIVANNKVYDGTAAATLTTAGATLNDAVAGDDVALDTTSFSALFANKHAGTAKSVTVTGLGLSGADAGNYTFTQPSGLTASITPAPLTITAVTNSKTYDGTTSASATPLLTSGALVSGRSVHVAVPAI